MNIVKLVVVYRSGLQIRCALLRNVELEFHRSLWIWSTTLLLGTISVNFNLWHGARVNHI